MILPSDFGKLYSMTTQDLKQIDKLLEIRLEEQDKRFDVKLDAKLKVQTDRLENTMGRLAGGILDAVDTSMTYKRDFKKLEKKVERIQKTLQSV